MKAGSVVALLSVAVCAGCLVPRDVAPDAGIADNTLTHGENCVADITGDGNLDLILSTHGNPWTLYAGPAPFTSSVEFARRDRHGCAVADFDGDGRLDIYFSIGACVGECLEPKELWFGQPDGTFVDRAAEWGIDDPPGRGRVPVVLDANGDGRPDLFTGQEEGVDYPSPNRLWINQGDHFTLHDGPPTVEIGNLCSAAADIDGDGYDELAVCTPARGFHLYRNLGGTFVDDPASFGIASWGRRTVEFADVDGDGRLDFVSVTRTRVQVHRNEGGRFGPPIFDLPTVDAKDVALGDVEGDGDLDLYVQMGSATTEQDRIWLNDGTGAFAAGPRVPADDGAGDSVVVLPGWNGLRDAFVVNNGFQETAGTRQLVEVSGEP